MTRSLSRDIRFRGKVENRHDANDLLEKPGDTVTVIRGRPRSFVMACPDGCGSVLTVNLDPRAGKAWRLYERGGLTLVPSVWRDAGCQAHFIVWRDRIVWCEGGLPDERADPVLEQQLEVDILAKVGLNAATSGEIAVSLDAIPYDVDLVLVRLVRRGKVRRLPGKPPRFLISSESASVRAVVEPPPRSKRPAHRSWWRRLLGR